MKSSNLVAIDERLSALRYELGLEWGQLAERLEISRAMLGFIRREDKTPSAKLLHRIVELEKSAGSNMATNCNNCSRLQNRVTELEQKLSIVNEALHLILQGTAKLREAVK